MRRWLLVAWLVAFAAPAWAQDVRVTGYDAPLAGSAMSPQPTPPTRIPLLRSAQDSPRDRSPSTSNSLPRPASVPRSALTVVASFGIVLGLFLVGAWVLRRGAPNSAQLVPTEVAELLGRVPLVKGQHAQLLRIGNKIVVVAISASGSDTITEITEPAEVERIARQCRATSDNHSPETFRRLFLRFGGNRAASAASHTSDVIESGIDLVEDADV